MRQVLARSLCGKIVARVNNHLSCRVTIRIVHLHQCLDARVYQELSGLFYAIFLLAALSNWFHNDDICHAILPLRHYTLKDRKLK
jgi:hypothetical protein